MKIDIIVREKIAWLFDPNAFLICGNSGIPITFDFDEEWEQFETKTARFSFNGSYVDVVFKGNEVYAPMIKNTNSVKIGVFAGNLQTTTPATIPAKKSILCENGFPENPEESVYAQLIEMLNGVEKGDKGDPGKDGTSIEHEWEGTKLHITSASGTSFADLKGEKGDAASHEWNGTVLTITSASGTSSADLKGEKGDPGKDAPGITIDSEMNMNSTNPVQNKVIAEAWEQLALAILDMPKLPEVTEADNGKVLQVVNSAWAAVEIKNGNEVAY